MAATAPSLLLVGAGNMALAYSRVLTALGQDHAVLGRGAASAAAFAAQTGIQPTVGTIEAQLAARSSLPDTAIIAVNATHLAEVTIALLNAGVRRILVEKPAALDLHEAARLTAAAAGAEAYVGYNRRFLASTLRAAQMITEDGGVLSVKFDFTERARFIAGLAKPKRELDTWFYGNSSHVVDLAFHFFGPPVSLSAQVTGSLPWHPGGAVFAGQARNNASALMSWHANWMAPGRWGVEVMTPERRLTLQPLESLQVQRHDRFDAVAEPLDDSLDRAFKPGLVRQVRAFLFGEGAERLLHLADHARAMAYYDIIRTGGHYAAPIFASGETR